MQLTNEQLRAADHGPVTVQAEGREYVIMAKEVYDRAQQALDYDDSEMDPRETYPAVLKAWDSQGSPDDATDYEDLV